MVPLLSSSPSPETGGCLDDLLARPNSVLMWVLQFPLRSYGSGETFLKKSDLFDFSRLSTV